MSGEQVVLPLKYGASPTEYGLLKLMTLLGRQARHGDRMQAPPSEHVLPFVPCQVAEFKKVQEDL